jgi:hypothetical protein
MKFGQTCTKGSVYKNIQCLWKKYGVFYNVAVDRDSEVHVSCSLT